MIVYKTDNKNDGSDCSSITQIMNVLSTHSVSMLHIECMHYYLSIAQANTIIIYY